ncbi:MULTISPECIES: CaiB/BaiF CoA transferase family protein [Aminobacter]|jgi:crotonobetainyl-CoA:carnitine CoA-transferase CaiB-like acyl-CoA transferase|uniref:CAIB/BAIF family protein n=1 Tax=Aminobacter aminovorans TaxID=83263 RepID=A0AAC8YW30_AMIAI|nr:CoA transferase [Aminobacter aminovorans]AMS45278.1 CAIB/BAIF family protein [Aminobacter aminovorans]MBB3704957.1 crotonobetainyl-CoA:carnitine CoA-transferase CaiB-like acyl-CoA transferase [Aminobacter aminovorans]
MTEMSRQPIASRIEGLQVVEPAGGFDFLRGMRVVDLSSSVAGPYASMLLADMGADVIKVERPGGDDARGWGPPFLAGESLWFISVNRNKRSIGLDYSTPAGLQALYDLVRSSDALIVNTPPRAARKLGIDADAIRQQNPKLVYTSITGFGIDSDRADWPCYDLIAEGYSGVMDLTGDAYGEPQKVGAPAADMLAGQDAAFATVAALLRRQTGGSGATVDVSLVDSMVRFLACRIVPHMGSGDTPRRSGGKDSVIAIYQAFNTADEPITLGLGNDNIWGRFWDAIGQSVWKTDPRYATNALRRQRREEIVAAIQDILVTAPRAHWLSLFSDARIPAGPINRVDEVVLDAELRKRGLFYQLQSGEKLIPQVGTAIRVDGQTNFARSAPPEYAQHTHEILRECLGYDDAQLIALRDNGAI